MSRPVGKPNHKKYKRMTDERHNYLVMVWLLMTQGKSHTQARRLARLLLYEDGKAPR